jgi:[acyl-carrier-protein] S-malonyltransferase
MFSVIFPGQGSQMVGMGKEFYDKFDLVKNLFKEADDTLNFSMSKLILEGSERGVRPYGKYSTSNIFNQLFNL